MKISVKGLEISACHGVLDFEKVTPQPFIFDIVMDVDCDDGAREDEISKTVDYSAVCALAERVTRQRVRNLIENLARDCAFAILENFERVNSVAVTVGKPQAPMDCKFGCVYATFEAKRRNAVLSLGSSEGDRRATLDSAIEKISSLSGVKVKKVSSFIETAPYGGVAKNNFINCALIAECFLSANELLALLQGIEKELGRKRLRRWDDRTIDIDVIFFGDEVIAEEGLAVPHPHYAERDFVIRPLKEICPEFVCPLTHRVVKDL